MNQVKEFLESRAAAFSCPPVKAPHYGAKSTRMIERLPEDSNLRWAGRNGVRQWHLRIASGVYVIVTSSARSHWRVKGIAAFECDRPVDGGPQKAANEAFAEVQKLAAILKQAGKAA